MQLTESMGRLRYFAILCVLSCVVCQVTGCDSQRELTFDQLFTDPDKHSGKLITIEGFCFHGFKSMGALRISGRNATLYVDLTDLLGITVITVAWQRRRPFTSALC